MDEPELAMKIANEALQNATDDLEHIMESYKKESTLLMQQLRDNIAAWSEK